MSRTEKERKKGNEQEGSEGERSALEIEIKANTHRL